MVNSGLRVIYPENTVRAAIEGMATDISISSCSRCLHLLGVLDGGRWLVQELEPVLRERGIQTSLSFLKVERTRGDGILGPPKIDESQEDRLASLEDRCILLVDDICDEGETLQLLSQRAAALTGRVWSAVLIERTQPRRNGFSPTFSALTTEERGWLVGCGMDSQGEYRELPFIGVAGGAG